jgi:hypothetical protein
MAIPGDLNSRQQASYVEVGSGTVAQLVTHQIGSYLGTVNVGSAVALGTLVSPINGLVRSITQTTPSMGSITGTATTSLLDSSGGTIIALPAQAEGAVVTTGTIQPIDTSMSFVTTTTGDPNGTITTAGGANIVLNVHYEL